MKKIISAIAVLSLFAAPLAFADSTVTATAGVGASVSPSGTVVVPTGEVQAFAPSAGTGYTLSSVVLDGVSQPLSEVDFTGIVADDVSHILSVGATANAPTGGSMPWCSSPLAPGYNVSMPGGGCGNPTTLVSFGSVTSVGLCMFKNGCMIPNK
jgi:hypothetical protein